MFIILYDFGTCVTEVLLFQVTIMLVLDINMFMFFLLQTLSLMDSVLRHAEVWSP